ncbi:hypothetical protein PoB_000279400 [Plakobranchus ocellatus]|uniref:Uncharacterized protein n=1 Tax=Plakobranchus ocellatus TaxID=259542 RepID=A0AAV3Y013_9GAST|nr:hypothetical protein PoB_000279400 [Plakobranchus ocellatus]
MSVFVLFSRINMSLHVSLEGCLGPFVTPSTWDQQVLRCAILTQPVSFALTPCEGGTSVENSTRVRHRPPYRGDQGLFCAVTSGFPEHPVTFSPVIDRRSSTDRKNKQEMADARLAQGLLVSALRLVALLLVLLTSWLPEQCLATGVDVNAVVAVAAAVAFDAAAAFGTAGAAAAVVMRHQDYEY